MASHHPLGPSTLNYRAVCRRFVPNPSQSNGLADKGTEAHKELSRLLTQGGESENDVATWAKGVLDCYGEHKISEMLLTGTMNGLEGIFGTADCVWIEMNEGAELHIADLKSFSEGVMDYFPQVKAYAALWTNADCYNEDIKVVCHILHGGIKWEEIKTFSMKQCVKDTVKLLTEVRSGVFEPVLCSGCQYCSRISTCPACHQMVDFASKGEIGWVNLSLPKKLIVLEQLEKLSDAIRNEAKAQAIENDGILTDGDVEYRIKMRSGKGRFADIPALASMANDNGVPPDEFIALCNVGKTDVINAIYEKNKDKGGITKKGITELVNSYYVKGEDVPCLVRTK